MNILIKFPTRSRPDKFFQRMDELFRRSKTDQFFVSVTLDLDDPTMNNSEVKERIKKYPRTEYTLGTSKGKIDAINRDMELITYPWDIVVVMSDDMINPKVGWDLEVIKAFEIWGLDAVCHWPDGNWYNDKLVTMSIMGRDYYNRFNYLYQPEYISLWCDNEFGEVAKILDKYYYMGGENHKNVLFTHFHPAHTKGAESDELLKHTESFYEIDKATYEKRKAINFGL